MLSSMMTFTRTTSAKGDTGIRLISLISTREHGIVQRPLPLSALIAVRNRRKQGLKKIAVMGLFLVVCGIAGILYLNYDLKRFESSHPKTQQNVSSYTEKDTVLEGSKDTAVKDTDFSESIVPPPAEEQAERTDQVPDSEQTYPPEISLSLDLEHGHTQEGYAEIPSIDAVDLRPPPGMSLAVWMDSLSPEEKQAVYLQKPWLKPIHEMTPQEVETEVARRKQRLIDTYGNTQEVQLINKYTTAPALLGEPQTMTGDESVEHARAMSVLWPTPENIAYYRELKSFQEHGWHVD